MINFIKILPTLLIVAFSIACSIACSKKENESETVFNTETNKWGDTTLASIREISPLLTYTTILTADTTGYVIYLDTPYNGKLFNFWGKPEDGVLAQGRIFEFNGHKALGLDHGNINRILTGSIRRIEIDEHYIDITPEDSKYFNDLFGEMSAAKLLK